MTDPEYPSISPFESRMSGHVPEMVGPDPVFMDIVRRVLDQNSAILEMNAKLLAAMGTPPMIVKREQP